MYDQNLRQKIFSRLGETFNGSSVIPSDDATMSVVLYEIFVHLGLPMADENFTQTPGRWLRALAHYIKPYDPAQDLGVTFQEHGNTTASASIQVPAGTSLLEAMGHAKFNHSMVIQTPIPYRALCAHHLLPVYGTAHVGYIPNGHVVGLSKLSRLVYGLSHRLPSLQEHVCAHVVSALTDHLKPLGAACVIDAHHGCMQCRGVEEVGIRTITSHVSGAFEQPEVRSEFMSLIKGH